MHQPLRLLYVFECCYNGTEWVQLLLWLVCQHLLISYEIISNKFTLKLWMAIKWLELFFLVAKFWFFPWDRVLFVVDWIQSIRCQTTEVPDRNFEIHIFCSKSFLQICIFLHNSLLKVIKGIEKVSIWTYQNNVKINTPGNSRNMWWQNQIYYCEILLLELTMPTTNDPLGRTIQLLYFLFWLLLRSLLYWWIVIW